MKTSAFRTAIVALAFCASAAHAEDISLGKAPPSAGQPAASAGPVSSSLNDIGAPPPAPTGNGKPAVEPKGKSAAKAPAAPTALGSGVGIVPVRHASVEATSEEKPFVCPPGHLFGSGIGMCVLN